MFVVFSPFFLISRLIYWTRIKYFVTNKWCLNLNSSRSLNLIYRVTLVDSVKMSSLSHLILKDSMFSGKDEHTHAQHLSRTIYWNNNSIRATRLCDCATNSRHMIRWLKTYTIMVIKYIFIVQYYIFFSICLLYLKFL